MTVGALITAGGRGARMGGAVAKQYLDLGGLPILSRTVLAFDRHQAIVQVVVTVPEGDEELVRQSIIAALALEKPVVIVTGGPDRQASVYNGLLAMRAVEYIAIHDGVRPLVSRETITRALDAARSVGAAVACVAVRETLKRRNGEFLETIPRSDLWLARTPQAFRADLILEAHRRAREEGFRGTDDSILVERLGYPVAVVEDTEENIKITTRTDLELAKVLLSR